MSEKKAKANRKQVAIPHPVYAVTVSLMSDNTISVNGFPKDLALATEVLDQGKKVMINFFIQAAKEGRLNEQNVIDSGNILVPDKNIVRLS